MDGYMVLASAIVGLLVGMTGAGGGALMTPMLILLFSVKPSTAISSDLVATLLMRPFGAAVHLRRRTVNLRLVGWMSLGSVPAAFAGACLLGILGHRAAIEREVQVALGIALLLGAAAMAVRAVLDRRSAPRRTTSARDVELRPLWTLLIGAFGGFVVGFTSVGAGSLMVVLLMSLYPAVAAKSLVGTDLTQAVPLTAAAALGALVFGHVELTVTASLVVGAVPAVIVGSLLSAWAPDRYLRPAIGFVILASGLKYVGLATTELAWALGASAAAGLVWFALHRPRRERLASD